MSGGIGVSKGGIMTAWDGAASLGLLLIWDDKTNKQTNNQNTLILNFEGLLADALLVCNEFQNFMWAKNNAFQFKYIRLGEGVQYLILNCVC